MMFQSRITDEMPVENTKQKLQDGHESSLNKSPLSCSVTNRGKSVPLNELLDKIPLAYSPLTKQLHIIYPMREGSSASIDTCCESTKAYCMNKDEAESENLKCSVRPSIHFTSSSVLNDDDQVDHDMSHVSGEEVVGASEGDGSSLSSETSHQPEESLVDDGTKRKKRGISGFFSRYCRCLYFV